MSLKSGIEIKSLIHFILSNCSFRCGLIETTELRLLLMATEKSFNHVKKKTNQCIDSLDKCPFVVVLKFVNVVHRKGKLLEYVICVIIRMISVKFALSLRETLINSSFLNPNPCGERDQLCDMKFFCIVLTHDHNVAISISNQQNSLNKEKCSEISII